MIRKNIYAGFTLIRTRKRNLVNVQQGFTLIELLVVISIIGILIGVSIFGLGGARESARDGKRRGDLELIRSGLEIYQSDCGEYPASLAGAGGQLVGDAGLGLPGCSGSNVYISEMPADPQDPARTYFYAAAASGETYVICSSLEDDPGGNTTGCGSCTMACNYRVVNP